LVPAILGFLACTAAIVWAGTRLTAYADMIAERTRLGRVWAGMLLLAVATSLPELLNSTSAAVLDLPDIAVGDLAGSNALNLVILGLADVFSRHRSCLHNLDRFHFRSASIVGLMSAFAFVALMAGRVIPQLGWISPITPVLLALYVCCLRKADRASETAVLSPVAPHLSFTAVVTRYALLALVVIIAAVLLPRWGSQIAVHTGLGNTFVGTTMIAAATSLPELVTVVAAVRLGAAEMAVGGILGSNLFNLAILGLVDVVYWRGNLFAAVEHAHAIPLLTGVVLVALFTVVMANCPRGRFLRITWFGWVALAVYVTNAVCLYFVR